MTPRATASEIERQAADWLAREDAAPLPADAQAELNDRPLSSISDSSGLQPPA